MVRNTILIVAIIIVALAISGGFYIVPENQQAIITMFGKPTGDVKKPGPHVKIPFVHKEHKFENRILKWDGDPNQIPTKDKRYIWVDTTARWRIEDPLTFLTTVGTEKGAMSRLDDIIDSLVRDAVSSHLLVELVRGEDYKPPQDASGNTQNLPLIYKDKDVSAAKLKGREEILTSILEKAQKATPEYGIEIIDVMFKRINYVEQVRTRVYERMISERQKVASEYRSEGEGEKARIIGLMKQELKQIRSTAERKALEIKGEADAKAAAIYAQAYRQDPEFYAFKRRLDSYETSIGANTRLLLDPRTDFYQSLFSPDNSQ